MKTLIIKLHNMSVSNVIQTSSEETAKLMIRDMFFEKIGRVMSDEEIDDLEDHLEITNDDDHDNHFTWSINSLA